MSYITKAQLEAYGRGFTITNEFNGEMQAKAAATYSWQAETTIFLSHSHKDRGLIESSIAFLRSHGVKVYVDWLDSGMPDTVSGDTAKKIKEKIGQQKKFMVMVTENSKDSRWVPWELGYADPVKGMDHIASFPVGSEYDFSQNEYMKIYPKVYYIIGTWYIWQDDPLKITRLDEWLKK